MKKKSLYQIPAEMSNTQSPITTDNEILEPSEEEPRDFDKI